MARSKSSKKWLQEHFSDPFVRDAQQQGYRSRAVYKLSAIQEKDKIISSGSTVVDLGAAPGGWSQIVAKWVGSKGKIIAMDILAMDPLPGVDFIQGDFKEQQTWDLLLAKLDNKPVDVVLSDMAPNMSGVDSVDQAKAMYLAELALDMAQQILQPNGHFIVKVFQGEGFDPFLLALKKAFKKVVIRKPPASRSRSNEIYLVAKEFK